MMNVSLPYNYVTPDDDFTLPTGWDGLSGKGFPIADFPVEGHIGSSTIGNITKLPDNRSYNTIDRKKFRPVVNASYNNASTYIFMAFAESPFQTANAK